MSFLTCGTSLSSLMTLWPEEDGRQAHLVEVLCTTESIESKHPFVERLGGVPALADALPHGDGSPPRDGASGLPRPVPPREPVVGVKLVIVHEGELVEEGHGVGLSELDDGENVRDLVGGLGEESFEVTSEDALDGGTSWDALENARATILLLGESELHLPLILLVRETSVSRHSSERPAAASDGRPERILPSSRAEAVRDEGAGEKSRDGGRVGGRQLAQDRLDELRRYGGDGHDCGAE